MSMTKVSRITAGGKKYCSYSKKVGGELSSTLDLLLILSFFVPGFDVIVGTLLKISLKLIYDIFLFKKMT